ncbi:MAG: hypothetical protein WD627_10240, partial [Actinomycetota bacterium]
MVLSGALSTFAYAVTRNQLIQEREKNALNQVFQNARSLRNMLRSGEVDVPQALSTVGGTPQSVVLARVGGEWFSGSVGTGPSAVPVQLADLVSSDGAARQRTRIEGRPFVTIGVAIPAYSARYFEFIPVDDIERTLEGLARGLALTAALATLCGAAMGWLATG